MEGMPDEILCKIMDLMDDETLLNSVKASERFMVAFSNSSRLLSRFVLKVNPENINLIINDNMMLEIPFKNVSMSKISRKNFEDFQHLANALEDSIETLELRDCFLKGYDSFIGPLSQLNELTLRNCSAKFNEPYVPKMENLKSVTLEECVPKIFSLLKNQPKLEKLRVCEHEYYKPSSSTFNKLASSLPKLKHLVFESVGTYHYLEITTNFPFRIEKFEAYLLRWCQNWQPRLEFFMSQKGSLKELTLQMLPHDYGGNEVLKYIIEEMQLESFHYGKIPLILNGQKQDVKEFLAFGININAALEILRQFPTIETFNLFLHHGPLDNSETLRPRTDLFKNVRHLNIIDPSCDKYDHFYLFRGLYKNCRNIRKLTINSFCCNLDNVLQEVLPELTQLHEIVLRTILPNPVSQFQLIRNFAPNVKKLNVNANLVNKAKEVFENDKIEIIGVEVTTDMLNARALQSTYFGLIL